MTHHLYVATNGFSVWSSSDLGETISRMPSSTGIYSGSQVWSLAVHPTEPGRATRRHRQRGLSARSCRATLDAPAVADGRHARHRAGLFARGPL